MTDAKQKSVPERVFLRTHELIDLCEFEGAEGDVFCIHSPKSIFITHHTAYVPESALNEAAAIIERKDRDISALRQQVETLRQAAQVACRALEGLRDAVCTAVNWEIASKVNCGDAPWISKEDAKDVYNELARACAALEQEEK